MKPKEPIHLRCNNPTPDQTFAPEEKIFRRIKMSTGDKEGDYFSNIKTEQFVQGVSVNRDKFGSVPQDALWSIIDGENNCIYHPKVGEVVYTTPAHLSSTTNQTGINIFCEHSPFRCNCSHCDLKFAPDISGSPKSVKVKVKLFMNTVFFSTGINNYLQVAYVQPPKNPS